ncbi:hypothetical protein N665_0304s0029 [Sinapis alba]|nr:hypothetical protein N665_0304s0029 [Sinapis alba]
MNERDSKESSFEGSNIKRMRLADDDDEVLRSLERTLSSSSSSSSLSYSGEEDHQSSSVTRLPFLDLEQISETEISSLITINFRRTQQGSEILGETAEMDSSAKKTETREKKEKAPTQAELDDFFSAAERFQQKRFTDKYNYDIVNDTPLEGRYEWVSLKP